MGIPGECGHAHRLVLKNVFSLLLSRLILQSLTYVKKNGLEKDVVILVLELAGGGELFDFMMYTGAFPEVIARTYFVQVRRLTRAKKRNVLGAEVGVFSTAL